MKFLCDDTWHNYRMSLREFPMVCDFIWFISNKLCVFYYFANAQGEKTHNLLNTNHIPSREILFIHIYVWRFDTLKVQWCGYLTFFMSRYFDVICNIFQKCCRRNEQVAPTKFLSRIDWRGRPMTLGPKKYCSVMREVETNCKLAIHAY
jgi:hypothetical protein